MFQHAMQDIRNMSRSTAREVYRRWCDENLIPEHQFPFNGKKEFIAKKDRQWTVASFGDYRDASNDWRRFIAYRCNLGTLTVVYQWRWLSDEDHWSDLSEQKFGSW